ncbi:hypothetical protein XA68_16231 [Ophiocordyceps unilateralis]|uniref:Uncharacterized protein n=1 Tax=Ophiocordyceps unilateralis TaxID=268505 RepID=A0A2A9PLN4_OPHUN|nr:hypothetical protein XA68_16231 [Ophiocordyceps unilateralis]
MLFSLLRTSLSAAESPLCPQTGRDAPRVLRPDSARRKSKAQPSLPAWHACMHRSNTTTFSPNGSDCTSHSIGSSSD